MAPAPPPISFPWLAHGSPLIGQFARKAADKGSRHGRELSAMICWISAIEAAKRSKGLSDAGAAALNQVADANNAGGLFPADSCMIRTQAGWLAIPEGLLVGALARPYGNQPGPRRLSHVMISLGNGLVVGSNNMVLGKPSSWYIFNLDEVMTWAGNAAYYEGRDFEVRVRPIEDRKAGSICP